MADEAISTMYTTTTWCMSTLKARATIKTTLRTTKINGDWYHVEDERICRTEDTDEFLMANDGCWQCEESGNWYTDSIDFVEVEGCKYHPDHAPASDDVEATMLTMDMLSEVSLLENYTIQRDIVRFSMTLLHDGVKLFAHRDVPSNHIATHGMDQVRTDMRKMICTELMYIASINANLKLESTDTI